MKRLYCEWKERELIGLYQHSDECYELTKISSQSESTRFSSLHHIILYNAAADRWTFQNPSFFPKTNLILFLRMESLQYTEGT